jgi:thiol:disulfide interchange protein DsbD
MDAVRSGRTIFVDYTAEWCVNCKANEKLVLDTAEVRDAMRRLGVVPFKADYTSPDPEIKEDLERFNRSGVPMYVVYPANQPDKPILLDELLTKSSVINALNRAGPSETADPSRVSRAEG